MNSRPAITPTFEVPADLPRNPGSRVHQERTETYLAAGAAVVAGPSQQTYRAVARAAWDLHTAYSYGGSCCHGIVEHPLAHVGRELLRQAVAFQHPSEHDD